mmetsp:Transcript_36050/g.64500  ORF Transcript_36050/g.64500 Transcript_36050/m.64500 type:complete len:262 (-) Transcript_36050:73-858(-)
MLQSFIKPQGAPEHTFLSEWFTRDFKVAVQRMEAADAEARLGPPPPPRSDHWTLPELRHPRPPTIVSQTSTNRTGSTTLLLQSTCSKSPSKQSKCSKTGHHKARRRRDCSRASNLSALSPTAGTLDPQLLAVKEAAVPQPPAPKGRAMVITPRSRFQRSSEKPPVPPSPGLWKQHGTLEHQWGDLPVYELKSAKSTQPFSNSFVFTANGQRVALYDQCDDDVPRGINEQPVEQRPCLTHRSHNCMTHTNDIVFHPNNLNFR